MELVVADFVNPVPAMIVVECQNRPVRLSQIPDPHCAICSASRHSMQAALVISQVEHLINVSDEADITIFGGLLTEIYNTDGIFNGDTD